MSQTLPIIDITDLLSPDETKRRAVGIAMHNACRAYGFFYCIGHGVPDELMHDAMSQTKAFFDQSLAAKLAVDKAQSTCNRGYEILGGQTLQPGALPDRKEGFYIGEDLAEDNPRVIAGEFNQGPNQWPSDLPDFKTTMMTYFSALSSVSTTLMNGLALSLSLDENAFTDFTNRPLATLRLLHYPPQRPEVPDEKGAGAHTDFGGLTLLLQDEVGGLQVHDHDNNNWIDAPYVEGAFIVNLGDMIARWTNDIYKSTLHRVINRSGKERYSIPFFYTGNHDYVVSCIPTCLAANEKPNYPPIRVEDHLRAMYARTYVTD